MIWLILFLWLVVVVIVLRIVAGGKQFDSNISRQLSPRKRYQHAESRAS
ncbi:MAG TPA: hypothetical protein VNN76_09450 [Bacteroidota bacterium]|nr:hypothetical protein [Bacteroidota bacterium]